MVGHKLVDRSDRLFCGGYRVRLGRLADTECEARLSIGLRPAGGSNLSKRDGGDLSKEDRDGLPRGVNRTADNELLQLFD